MVSAFGDRFSVPHLSERGPLLGAYAFPAQDCQTLWTKSLLEAPGLRGAVSVLPRPLAASVLPKVTMCHRIRTGPQTWPNPPLSSFSAYGNGVIANLLLLARNGLPFQSSLGP